MLIKIKNSVPAVGTDEGPRIILNKPTFIRIMKAPGYPCYSAKKTIMEKWNSMPDYWNLVSRHATPEEGPEVYFLNVETIDELINQFMPEEAKNNYAAKQIYLKTGRC